MLKPLESLRKKLVEAGVEGKIIDVTPMIINRGDEILKWIQDNNYIGDYLVIDDNVHEIAPYKDIPSRCIIHVRDGWEMGGLKDKHIDPILNRGMIS